MTFVAQLRAAAALAAGLTATACTPGTSDLASFIDGPFGDISAEVGSLNETQLEAVMDTVMLRFRLYLELRDAVPFSAIAPEACMTDVRSASDSFSFIADVGCTFGDAQSPAEGTIAIAQAAVADEPPVVTLDVDYRDVIVGAVAIDGTESITETDAVGGASVRVLDVVQGGVELDYRFRLGTTEDDVPVFDYPVTSGGDGLLARVTNPQTPGALVTVFLIGVDGALECEVRDTAWTVDEPARGFCDNGLVFGLPDAPDPEAVTP